MSGWILPTVLCAILTASSEALGPEPETGIAPPAGERPAGAASTQQGLHVDRPLKSYGLGKLRCVAVSPNPSIPIVATGGGAGVILWDQEMRHRLRTLRHPGHLVLSLAFSPDARTLITGGTDATARLWHVSEGGLIRTFRGHEAEVSSVAFSPSGDRIATGSEDDTVRIWSAQTGRVLQVLKPLSPYPRFTAQPSHFDIYRYCHSTFVAFLESDRLLTGRAYWRTFGRPFWHRQGSVLKLWDALNGQELRAHRRLALDSTIPLSVSPRGTTVMMGGVSGVATWQVESGRIGAVPFGTLVSAIAYAPDGGSVLVGHTSGKVVLWDQKTLAQTQTFAGAGAEILSVGFSPDAMSFFTSDGFEVKTYDTKTREEIAASQPFAAFGSESVAIAPDGETIFAIMGGNVRAFDTATRDTVWEVAHELGDPLGRCVAVSPDGSHVLVGDRSGAKLRDSQTGKPLLRLEKHRTRSVAFVNDGTRALLDNVLFDLSTGRRIRTFGWLGVASDTENCNAIVRASGTGNRVITGFLADNPPPPLLTEGTSRRLGDSALTFAPGAHRPLAIPSYLVFMRTPTVYALDTGKEIARLGKPGRNVMCVDASVLADLVLTGETGGSVKVWDVKTSQLVRSYEAHRGPVTCAAFHPSGKAFLTAGADGILKIWALDAAAPVKTVSGHTGGILSAVFSSDGTRIATGGEDGLLLLWESGL